MLLFYTKKLTPRVRYAARLLFQNLLGINLRFSTSKSEYLQSTLPKINYSQSRLQSGMYLKAANLLFETDIFEKQLKKSDFNGTPIFFLTDAKSSLPFDPLAAAFFLVTRYEEYIPFLADHHKRFAPVQSLTYHWGVLQRPLVNEYAFLLKDLLQKQYPQLKLNLPRYRFINSVDIDNASAYRGKGLFRMMAGYIRDISAFKFHHILSRTQSIFLGKTDPFETFEWQLQQMEKHGFSTLYFALFSKLGPHDRNLHYQSPRLQAYLKSINDFCEVGIHPSYQSQHSLKIIEREKVNLENLIKREVTKSRQHFLRLSFPETYRNLLQLEITDDYTMGYAAESGFRAGICSPFRFYDLEQELETPLTIHPFPFMDGTYIYYKNMPVQQALQEMEMYINLYKKYGGEFIPIWHNRIFSELEPEWKGWSNAYIEMIKMAT